MALDRWIALFILFAFCLYGYTAFFTMDGLLPPILQRNPVWPSSFPKLLAIGGIIISLVVILGFEKSSKAEAMDINYKRLTDYNISQAIALLAMMVGYALLLRPAGFLISTVLFLGLGSIVLGERRFLRVFIVAAVAAGVVWYLVDQVLGIFLVPLPAMLQTLGEAATDA
ncbi:MAG: tripartite tricarboxylate transporter TctB family protein [Pseudomonadota bacterium]